MKLSPSKSLLRLWTLANLEAWRCQAVSIEPAHFWLGALKLADPEILTAMREQGLPPEDCSEQASEMARILSFLEMDAKTATSKRREMRTKLLRGHAPRPVPNKGIPYLHRSESSRRLFEIAARKAVARQSTSLSPLHILESLFEMKLVSFQNL